MNDFEDCTDKLWATDWKTRLNICMVEKKPMFFASQLTCPSSSLSGGGTMNSRKRRAPAWGWGRKKETRDTKNVGKTVILSHSDHLSLFIPPKSWFNPGWNLQWPNNQSRATCAVTLRFHKISTVGGRACNFLSRFLRSQSLLGGILETFGDKFPSLMSLMCAGI